MREQLHAIEPLVPIYNRASAEFFWAAGDNAQALTLAQGLVSDDPARGNSLAKIYAAMGRYNDAADAVLNSPRDRYPPGAVEAAARLLRMAPAAAQDRDILYLSQFSWVFAYVGVPYRAFEFAEHNAESGFMNAAGGTFGAWQRDLKMARTTERFKALVRKEGLVDYWRARGWPQLCHPVGANDFACD